MSITLFYGCFQVELSVRDLDGARAFLEGVLGAEPAEQQLAREIGELFPGGGYRVDHLDCGQATFQLNEPSLSPAYRANKSVHRGYLERVGPCVANLNFYVDDIVHARELLAGLGAPTLGEGPSSVVPSLADYGPDNTRLGGETRPFLFMGSRHLIGLDLEIMEPNFLRFVDQTAQYPCFVRPQSETAHRELRLQRLRIAVDDLASTYDNLVRLFTPGVAQPTVRRSAGVDRECVPDHGRWHGTRILCARGDRRTGRRLPGAVRPWRYHSGVHRRFRGALPGTRPRCVIKRDRRGGPHR